MPDLIRLLHGNPMGLKKMVIEFRAYWQKKIKPVSEEGSSAQEPSKLNTSQLDTSMDVETGDKTEKAGLDDSKIDTVDNFEISKRQLEKKIMAIAVREKRQGSKYKSWYVKPEILQQCEMEEPALPNSWEYVSVKAPTWALEKTATPKVEEQALASVKVPPSVPKIMQFAQPMSPAQIQALGNIAGKEKKKDEGVNTGTSSETTDVENMEATETTPLKNVVVPPDQRTIKSMFSPVAKKSVLKTAKKSSPKTPANDKKAKTPTAKDKKAKTPTAKDKKAKTPTAKDKTALNPSTPKGEAKVTPNKPSTPLGKDTKGPAVLQTMLSSPELMKASSSPDKSGPMEQSSTSEEPMDVEIICLD